ncbi:PalH-domain-containing protein [Polychaeton citri CBS 116435]|uniref:PalH-domain-containing protein n=1 Tax=Polychaeton citri CBS 116435 TaxID=1314669 RepID=A0A9P4QF92_9PEZI|nr:PalH-domain-containing protein [Polychaeton citri CBS 116435]
MPDHASATIATIAAAATGSIAKRQLWGLPSDTTSSITPGCTPFTLPSNGVLSFSNSVITLTNNVIFQPECTGAPFNRSNGEPAVAHLDDPFYASTTPQTYVIAATTVIAWVLLVMLVITPRTGFMGLGSGPGFSVGHGIIGGANGGASSLAGIGSRPWLQKVATLTVAISLTIATADTFKVAEAQYNTGYMDASVLRDKVLGSLEIRVTRVISDVFLWLAQVQTLIRLFPRHKEKVLIKWIGFLLIVCDSTFSCLNSFMVNSQKPARHFVDAIPALSYLFELALGLLYAAWVIYYSLTKRRYAFYHPKMKNICLIALLSLVAVLTPVVFFVTDVSNPDVAGWGDYFRWVGAAAASVVVWEWVERIEALERDEKKDGILGREIFDGDEMLDVTPSEEVIWGRHANEKNGDGKNGRGGDGGGVGAVLHQSNALEQGLSGFANRFRRPHNAPRQHFPLGRAHSETTTSANTAKAGNVQSAVKFGHMPNRHGRATNVLGGPTPPLPIATPVSRADTASAASTVYVVQYDHATEVPQPVRRRTDAVKNAQAAKEGQQPGQTQHKSAALDSEKEGYEEDQPQPNNGRKQKASGQSLWATVPNPFKRKRTSPPAEVQKATAASTLKRVTTPKHNFSRWDFTNRLGVLAAETGDRFRDRPQHRARDGDVKPVTVVPAQPRGSGQAWSPDLHARHRAAAESQPDAGPRQHNSDETTGNVSGSTTLTNNSVPIPTGFSSDQPRTDDISPLHAGGSRPIVNRQNSQTTPPRADDISPQTPGSITVVPAPRRSPLRISETVGSSEHEYGLSPSSPGSHVRDYG